MTGRAQTCCCCCFSDFNVLTTEQGHLRTALRQATEQCYQTEDKQPTPAGSYGKERRGWQTVSTETPWFVLAGGDTGAVC